MLKKIHSAHGEAPPELIAQTPEWFIWISAAERLTGGDVFKLLERPDLDYWLTTAAAYAQYEAWVVKQAQKS